MKQPKLTEAEQQEQLATVTEWAIVDGMLRRDVKAPSFLSGIELVRQAAEVAEEMNHHADIDIRWRTVTFALVTHDSDGLTALDFEQARRIDALAVGLS